MDSGAKMVKRYQELGLADALNRHNDYPWACHELSLILRSAYSKLAKNLQTLIFSDTISAFRRLPEVQTNHGVSSANLLVQAAETSLPKQKRSLAVSEFKHAVVAHKRLGKARQVGDSMQLPQDVLVHIFSFLDTWSLVNVSATCWAWHSAAADNTLWRLQYSLMFGDSDCKTKEQNRNLSQEKNVILCPTVGEDATDNTDWREAFKRKIIGNSAWKSETHRAICGHCKSLIWMSCITSARSHHCHKCANQIFTIKPVSPRKIVDYLLGETNFTSSSSSESDDSDSDASSIITQRMRSSNARCDSILCSVVGITIYREIHVPCITVFLACKHLFRINDSHSRWQERNHG